MKKLIILILFVLFTSLLFKLSIEETQAYELDSYRGYKVNNNTNICGGFKACYNWGNDEIYMESYWHKRDYMEKLSHEFGHPFYSYILSDAQRTLWNDISSDTYDVWLENHGVNTEIEYSGDYAKESVTKGMYDEDFAEVNKLVQNNTDFGIPKPTTKLLFKMKLVQKWRDEYGISKEY